MYHHSPQPSAPDQRSKLRSGKYDWRTQRQTQTALFPTHSRSPAPPTPSPPPPPSEDPSCMANRSFDSANGWLSGRRSMGSSSVSSALTLGTSGTPYNFSFTSRGTSVTGSFDHAQERCINGAYRVTFSGNNSVKEVPTSVTINGTQFLLVERFVSGNSDGIYLKSKKIWEHIPKGQVNVFARAGGVGSPVPFPSVPASPLMLAQLALPQHQQLLQQPITTPSTPLCENPASPSLSVCSVNINKGSATSSGSGGGGYLHVASLCGLRKFTFWGDSAAAAVYNAGKEVPTDAMALECVDGEPGQLTAARFEQVRYWVIGCQEKHLLLRLELPEEDILAYGETTNTTTARRTHTALAQRIARTWRAQLQVCRISGDDLVALHDVMCRNQWTFCFVSCLAGWENLVDYHTDISYDEDDEEKDNDPDGGGELSNSKQESETVELAHLLSSNTMPYLALSGVENGSSSSSSSSGEDLISVKHVSSGSDSGSSRPGASSNFEGEVDDFLCFYAITTDTPSERGLCLPVEEAMSVFRQHRLRTVGACGDAAQVGSLELDAIRDLFASKLNSAGAVFYGTNESGVVVRVWRSRCYPFAMERAMQESILTHGLHSSALRVKLEKKLSGLSREVRPHVAEWEQTRSPFLQRFTTWLHSTKRLTPSVDKSALRELRGHWISLQRQYASEARESIWGIAPCSTQEGEVGDNLEEGAEEDDGEESDAAEPAPPPDVVMLIGPQGCGKSTLARALYFLLEQSGYRPRWLNQDEIGDRRGYLNAVHRATSAGSQFTHVILDKMNLDEDSRAEYTELQLRVVIAVMWHHAQGSKAMVNMCLDRVMRRGSLHRTFRMREGGPVLGSGQASSQLRSPSVSNYSHEVVGKSAGAMSRVQDDTKAEAAKSPDASNGETQELRRLRGILRDSVSRLEAPSDTPIVELDVTLNCNSSIQRVWSKLQDRGRADLPALSQLNVGAAFDTAFAYEKLLASFPHRVDSAVLFATERTDVLKLVPPELLTAGGTKKAVNEIFVLIHNFTDTPNPSAFVHFAELVNLRQPVQLLAKAVIADSRVTLLHVTCTGSAGGPSQCPMAPWNPCALSCKTAHCTALRRHRRTPSSPPGERSCCEGTSGGYSFFAVLAKAKKMHHRYAKELLDRCIRDPGGDPHVTVLKLPSNTHFSFNYEFMPR